ncbi:MAG: phenylalanine--tRNA ligase subunit alpha [Eubacteriales bacterium]|jgi:phenylalanyl-tRNA synthetase alpha chain|nr:phenylalanine--tRNA ligase subunit alpha [Eubacteriales bacterium]MDY2983365.1 phenylalanine--tRNA ligase subunit alpha [Eubacteriales bacterium]
MDKRLEQIKAAALEKLSGLKEEQELSDLQQQLFGKSGELTAILRTMGQISKEERSRMGAEVNKTKAELAAAMEEKKEAFRRKAQELKFKREALDVTEPGIMPQPLGSLHPMTQTYRTIRDALVGMGFEVFDGPEIELDDNNFTLLNLPLDHPARDMQDTFYINDKVLLRTHTSPCEIRALKTFKPPFRFLMPGRVFRVDEVDASHSPVFMQIEGFVVDKNLNLANLKGTLDTFIKALFGENVKTRLRPSYFPFTEPSAELDMSCTLCGGKGCRVCKGTGWIEILGCGMTNPHELENCGLDPKEWSAFAFGIGVDRVTSLKYGISDIRYEYENDARFLRQF